MRRKISGMVAAVAVMMTAGSASAMACGGLFTPCAPCGYAAPCAPAPVYVAPVVAYSGCYTGCGWAAERLADPVRQYYYVNQGPTYTGPGNWAPVRTYDEGSVSYARPYYGYRAHRPYGYRYGVRPAYRYGYGARLGYHAPRHSMRYGAYHHGAARYSVGPRMGGQHMGGQHMMRHHQY